ncbi:MAG TPA: hypothetical protein VGK02_10735 [Candidatus Aquicultor sp.]|jgi:hypothetical protein
MKKIALFITIIVLVVLSSQIALAAEFKANNAVTIPSGQTINDDLYVGGGTVVIDGTINGDLLIGGGNVTVNGPVRDDVMIGGGNVTINGNVGQTIRAGSGTLLINGSTGQDLVVAGGTIDVASKAKIGRDSVISGGTVRLGAETVRNLSGAGGDFTLDNRVGGNAQIQVSNTLTLTKNALINGNLTYSAPKTATFESGSKVNGKTTFHRVEQQQRGRSAASYIIGFIVSYLAALLFGIVLLALFPVRVTEIADTIRTKPWISLLIGFVLLIVAPIAIIILLVFVITIPIALVLAFLYALGLYTAKIFVGLTAGRFITEYFKLGGGNYVALLIGLLIVMLLGAIPFLGALLRFLYILFGLGAAAYAIYQAHTVRRTEVPAAPAPQ